MRVFISLFVGIMALVLTVALVIFAMQNIESVPLRFLPYSFTGNVLSITVGAATLGFLVALLLMLPGRMAEILHDRNITQQMEQAAEEQSAAQRRQAAADAARRESQQQSQRLQTQLRQLVSEREELVAERDRLRAERNKFRHQLAITQTELAAVPSATDTGVTNTPSRASSRSDVPDEEETGELGADPERIEVAPDRYDTNPSAEKQPAHADLMRDFRDSDPYDDEASAPEGEDLVSPPA